MIIKDKRARSLVTVMIVIAVVSLSLRIALEQARQANLAYNTSNAQASLKLISTALENYARDNQSVFPSALAELVKTNPVYLDKDYIAESPIRGYIFSCLRMEETGYNCSAVPVKCGVSGKTVFSVSTGGILITEDCAKKE